MDIYQKNGYENRMDYLESLSDDNCVPLSVVVFIADSLGPDEDFYGLVSYLEDYTAGCFN